MNDLEALFLYTAKNNDPIALSSLLEKHCHEMSVIEKCYVLQIVAEQDHLPTINVLLTHASILAAIVEAGAIPSQVLLFHALFSLPERHVKRESAFDIAQFQPIIDVLSIMIRSFISAAKNNDTQTLRALLSTYSKNNFINNRFLEFYLDVATNDPEIYANLFKQDKANWINYGAALFVAVCCKQTEAVAFFLKHMLMIDHFSKDSLWVAAQLDHAEIAAHILKRFDKEISAYYRSEVLKIAIELGHLSIVNLLLTTDNVLSEEGIKHCIDGLSKAEALAKEKPENAPRYQDIIDRLMQIPLVVFFKAIKDNNIKIVSAMQNTSACEMSLFHKNLALQYAVEVGSLEILNILLNDESICAAVTLHNNAVLNKAENLCRNNLAQYQPLVDRLKQIPDVVFIDTCRFYSEKFRSDLLEKQSNNLSADTKGQGLCILAEAYGERTKSIKLLLHRCGTEISEQNKCKALKIVAERQKQVSTNYFLKDTDIANAMHMNLACMNILMEDEGVFSAMTRAISKDNNIALVKALGGFIEASAKVKCPEDKVLCQQIIQKLIQFPSLAFYDATVKNLGETLSLIINTEGCNIGHEIKGEGLICAARHDNEPIVSILLSHFREEISENDKCQAVKIAAEKKHLKTINTLLLDASIISALTTALSKEGFEVKQLLSSIIPFINEELKVNPENQERVQSIHDNLMRVPSLAFYQAILKRDIGTLTSLLNDQPSIIGKEIKTAGITLATQQGDLETVSFLLPHLETELDDYIKLQLLEIATNRHYLAIVNMLLSDPCLFSALVSALLSEERFSQLLSVLISFMETQVISQSALDVEFNQTIIDRMNKIPALAFFNAILNNDIDKLSSVLDSHLKDIPVFIRAKGLNQAALHGHLPSLSFLLRHASSEITHEHKRAALMEALKKGRNDSVAILLHQDTTEMSAEDKNKALSVAIEHGHLQSVSFLFKRWHTQLSASDKSNALRNAAVYGKENIVAFLLDNYGNEISEYLDNALTNARLNKRTQVVSLLIDCCGTKLSVDSIGETFDYACSSGENLLVSHLLSIYGEKIKDVVKGKALVTASKAGQAEVLALLLEKCNTQIQARYKKEAFLNGAQKGSIAIVSLLLDRCAADIRDDDKAEALIDAAKENCADMVKLLLNLCDSAISPYIKHRLLLDAIDNSRLETVETLLLNESVLSEIGWRDYATLIEAKTQNSEMKTSFQPIMAKLLQIPVLAFAHAIYNNNIVVLSDFLDVATHSQNISTLDKYRAVKYAISNIKKEMITLLLNRFSDDFSNSNKHDILIEAINTGNLDIVNAVLRNASILSIAALYDNTALNQAQNRARNPENTARFQLIVERLLQIPTVDYLANPMRNLRRRSQGAENSMQALDKSQVRLVEALKKHYEAIYYDKSWDVILVEILSYLESEYAKSPAKDLNGDNLPLDYTSDFTAPQLRAYYQHRIHSAWRYLSIPNPWLSSDAYCLQLPDGTRFANIYDRDKELISYLWIAINDENVVLEEGFSIEGNKYVFAQTLGILGRSHNFDKSRPILDEKNNPKIDEEGKIIIEYYDDLEADKPTCERGVTQRLLEAPYGHPYIRDPAARELNANIVLLHMAQKLITYKEKESDDDNLFNKLEKLPLVILKDIHHEISESLFLFEGSTERSLTTDENTAKIQALTIPKDKLNSFIDGLYLFFTPQRINTSTPINHNCFKGSNFAGYLPFIYHCAKNPLIAFSEQIYSFLRRKILSAPPVLSENRDFMPAFHVYSRKQDSAEASVEEKPSENSKPSPPNI